jgi:hypothetical protein
MRLEGTRRLPETRYRDFKSTRRTAIRHGLVMSLLGTISLFPATGLDDRTTSSDRKSMIPNPRLFSFVGGTEGLWRVTSVKAVVGDPLHPVARLNVVPGATPLPAGAEWMLRGVTSNERYVTRPEKSQLLAKQPSLARPEATCAALIPVRKNAKWWSLTQDERRHIFETESHHTQIGLEYLPAIARRLHHCRDLAEPEPFDFLTWFEFAESHAAEFDGLLAKLRATEEWRYVEREVEIRLTRDNDGKPK